MAFIRTFFLNIFPSTTSSNIIGTPSVPPNRALDFIPFHSIYAYLTGLLLTLVEINYQGSSNDLFREHSVIMMLFLGTKSAYVILLMTFQSNQTNDHALNLKFVVCHLLGTLSWELLILVLVSPIRWFIINVSSLVLVVATSFYYKYLLRPLNSAETQSSEIHNEEEGQVTEIPSSA